MAKRISAKTIRQEEFLREFKEHHGNIGEACSIVGIDRRTYYYWLDDEEIAAKVDAIVEGFLDVAEDALGKKVEAGDITATIFYLKTKGKKRGYVEKQEISATVQEEYKMQDPNG